MDRKTLLELLLKAPVTYSSNYFEVRELQVEGRRYRLVKQFAGNGKQRRCLPLRIEAYNPMKERWEKLTP